MIVGFCKYMTVVVNIKLVVVLTSQHFRNLEACAELDTLYRGDTENKLCNAVLQSLKDRRAYSCGDVCYNALDNSAETVHSLTSLCNVIEHRRTLFVVYGGKFLVP